MNAARVTRKPRFHPSPRRRLRRIGAALMLLSLIAALKAQGAERPLDASESPAGASSALVLDHAAAFGFVAASRSDGAAAMGLSLDVQPPTAIGCGPADRPRAAPDDADQGAADRSAAMAGDRPAPSVLGMAVALGLMLTALVRQPMPMNELADSSA